MKNLSRILEVWAYGASLILIASIPGLFIQFSDALLGSINRLIAGVVVLLWLLSVAAVGYLRRLHLFHWLSLAFALWYVISLWWSVAPDDSPFLLGVVEGAALTILIWEIYRSEARIQAAMQAFLLGGYVSVATTLGEFFQGHQARHWEKRFAGGGFDPNDIALLLAIGIPMAVYLAKCKPEPSFLRLLNFLYPIAAALGIILSGSRGALLAAAPAYLFYLIALTQLKPQWRIAMAVVLVVVVIGVTQLDLSEPLQRLGTVANSSSDDHFSGREDIWRAGWTVYGQHPLLGIGGGAFLSATQPLNGQGMPLIAHNTYLSVLTELGPVGFLVFAALIATVVASALRQPRLLQQTCLLALLVWAIGVFALSWEFRSQTWFLFALIVAAGHCESVPAGHSLFSARGRLSASLEDDAVSWRAAFRGKAFREKIPREERP